MVVIVVVMGFMGGGGGLFQVEGLMVRVRFMLIVIGRVGVD